MEEGQKIIEINSTYVDEHLREFFDANQTPVNIDNICLFSAKTIEEYNSHSETKLMGKQKLEAACELAKSIIDKVMVFAPEDQRRKISKNIYHNIDTIESTIQFIVNISNNPNAINLGKWIRADTVSETIPQGCFSRLFSCSGSKKKTIVTKKDEETPPVQIEQEKETKEDVSEVKETKKERKEREKKEAEERKQKKKDEINEKKAEEAKRKKDKKDEEERKRAEKKEREKKIKELLEETERKVKELKAEGGSQEKSEVKSEEVVGGEVVEDKDNKVEIVI